MEKVLQIAHISENFYQQFVLLQNLSFIILKRMIDKISLRRISLRSERGFTILELLIVVAIIAILSSAIMVSFSSTRAKSRDAARMATLHQLENALNLYFTNNNNFPIEESETTIDGSDTFSLALKNDQTIPEVSPDPLYPSSTYKYTYQSDSLGSTYTITFCLETDTIATYSKGCNNTITP